MVRIILGQRPAAAGFLPRPQRQRQGRRRPQWPHGAREGPGSGSQASGLSGIFYIWVDDCFFLSSVCKVSFYLGRGGGELLCTGVP